MAYSPYAEGSLPSAQRSIPVVHHTALHRQLSRDIPCRFSSLHHPLIPPNNDSHFQHLAALDPSPYGVTPTSRDSPSSGVRTFLSIATSVVCKDPTNLVSRAGGIVRQKRHMVFLVRASSIASVVTRNAFGSSSSGATQGDRAVRGNANLAQICVRFASPQTLGGRAEHPPFVTRSRMSGTVKSTASICFLFPSLLP
jgi:hypothetical protein